MKYFRIHLQPKSKLYFNVYILDTHENMMGFARKRLKNYGMPDFRAICDRNIQNNRIGQLFFNQEHITNEQIEHELIHILVSYLRYGHFIGVVKIDKLLQWQTQREEEIAYTFPYIKQKFNIKMGAAESLGRKAYKNFCDGKKYYRWDALVGC